MWSLFGDISAGPPGTYYHASSEHRVFFWNMFDQVLIRPDLLDAFNPRELEIIHTNGDISLLSSQNRPDDEQFSDHLPIRFTLAL